MQEKTTLGELAKIVDGQLCGDPETLIDSAAPLDEAQPGCITLIDSALRAGVRGMLPAAAAVFPLDVADQELTGIAVADVHAAFAQIVRHFRPQRTAATPGIHPTAVVSESAKVAASTHIGPHVVIGDDVTIGERVVIHPNAVVMAGSQVGDDVMLFPSATLYEDTVIGDRCIVHAGAVIGAYGFGYSQNDGRHVLAAQLGHVEIGADVEIGAGTTIDRGAYGPTRIGEGTKIDNLTQIAHNCQIGRHNLLCSQVGIAGSTKTGDYVVMGGQAGVRDHVEIGAGAQLSAMCGVSNNVAAGETVLGAPATPIKDQRLRFAAVAKLPAMRKEFKALVRQVEKLQQQIDANSGGARTTDISAAIIKSDQAA